MPFFPAYALGTAVKSAPVILKSPEVKYNSSMKCLNLLFYALLDKDNSLANVNNQPGSRCQTKHTNYDQHRIRADADVTLEMNIEFLTISGAYIPGDTCIPYFSQDVLISANVPIPDFTNESFWFNLDIALSPYSKSQPKLYLFPTKTSNYYCQGNYNEVIVLS